MSNEKQKGYVVSIHLAKFSILRTNKPYGAVIRSFSGRNYFFTAVYY